MHSLSPQELLTGSFYAALAAVNPLRVVPPHLPTPPDGRTLVAGAGKAAAAMAQAVETHYPAPTSGLVVTRYGYGLPTRHIEVIEAGHPLPDVNGQHAAQRILDTVRQLTANDLLLVLLSGGGSSLLSLPCNDIPLQDMQTVTHDLLRCGARIEEINTVRKHLSAIQGGQLAAATPARVYTLIISDVTGDDPTHIASGPCCADPTTYRDALQILAHYRINAPQTVHQHLQRGANGLLADTPKPGDSRLSRAQNHVIANGRQMLDAAAAYFSAHGITPINLGDQITGEARQVAQTQAKLIREFSAAGRRNIALISGGETTVTVHGNGKGGRNTEYLLALGLSLSDVNNVYALACDTDGIDGSETNAGAWLDAAMLADPALKQAAAAFLTNNDSFSFFEKQRKLIVSGPTRTNVNDYRVILLQ